MDRLIKRAFHAWNPPKEDDAIRHELIESTRNGLRRSQSERETREKDARKDGY